MSTRINLREDVQYHVPTNPLQVDEANSCVHGVKILSHKSKNGREYTKKAIRDAAKLYEGVKVNIDHPPGESGSRRFSDRFGRIANVVEKDDGLWADFQYNPKHSQAEPFLWFCRNDPGAVGFSHNALGEVHEDNGKLTVSEILEVYSVDLVADPASTKGLQESHMMDEYDNPLMPSDDGYEKHLGKLVAAIVNDAELPAAEKKKKLLQAVNLLDDDEPDVSPSSLGADPTTGDDDGSDLMDLEEDPTEDAGEFGDTLPDDVAGDEPDEEFNPTDSDTETPAESDPFDGDEEEEPESEEDKKKMKEELKKLKARVDAYEVREALEAKRTKVKQLCEDAKLPSLAVTDVFLAQLVEAKDDESVKRLIEDRRKVLGTRAPHSSIPGVQEMTVDQFVDFLKS